MALGGGSAATSGTSVTSSSSGVTLSRANLLLDKNTKISIPAGYYSSAINVSSPASGLFDKYLVTQEPTTPEAGVEYGYSYKKTSTKSSSGATRYKARVTCLICQRAGVTKYFDGDGGYSDETNSGQGGADAAARGKWLVHFVSTHVE